MHQRGAAPLLEVDGLSVEVPTRSGSAVAVDRASFAIRRGEILGLVGESGSGKTLTALSALRLLPLGVRVSSGRVTLDGQDVSRLSTTALRELRGARIGYVAQDATVALNPVLKVGTQVTETLRKHLRVGREAARMRAEELLRSVGIPEPAVRLHAYPHELSGGMCQRVAIAIAIACDPELLIADEPTTALDVTVQAQIMHLLLKSARDRGASVLLISHDLRLVATVTDRIVVMYAGKVVEQGRTGEIVRRPQHPYTSALLESTPRVRGRGVQRVNAIAGRLPDLLEMPDGCRFHPRCPYASERCGTEAPPERSGVACWHPNASRAPVPVSRESVT